MGIKITNLLTTAVNDADYLPVANTRDGTRKVLMADVLNKANVAVDNNLDVSSSNPVKNSAVAAAINALSANVAGLNRDIDGLEDSIFSSAAKNALLNCFQHVAWVDDQGQTYYNALQNALKSLSSISAVFTQGENVIYDTDTLSDLRQYLVVTATYSDNTTATITDYTLSGTLAAGTSTITVTYNRKTTTFTVTVTHDAENYAVTNTLTGCTSSNAATAIAEGSAYTATITADSNYTLTGATVSVTMGGVDITATAYSNGTISIASVTGALVITISAAALTVTSIAAVYTQSGTVYDTDSLDSLKADLVVTATYSDSSTATIAANDYTLSGTLAEGTSTITVTYGGQTATFTVTVTATVQVLGYVGDNLIMMLDGIANGEDGAHNTTVSSLVDQSGNGYDWHASQGTVTASDTALVFNGASNFAPSFSGNMTTPNTIECVIGVTTPSTTQCIIVGLSGDGGDTKYGTLGVKSSYLLHQTGGAAGCLPITTGVHTYTFVNTGSEWIGYVDGVLTNFGSVTVSWKTTYKRLGSFIGAGGTNPNYYFTGSVYSYRAYSDALSASEVRANYANDASRFGLS